MQGWTYPQIAAELGISVCTVVGRIARLYAQHGVRGGRKALARKLGVTLEPAKRRLTEGSLSD